MTLIPWRDSTRVRLGAASSPGIFSCCAITDMRMLAASCPDMYPLHRMAACM